MSWLGCSASGSFVGACCSQRQVRPTHPSQHSGKRVIALPTVFTLSLRQETKKEGKVYPQVALAWQTTLARASPTTHAQLPPPFSLDQHLPLSTKVWPPSSSSKRTSPAKQRPPRPTSCARTSSSKQPSRTRLRASRSVTIPSLLSLVSLAPCEPVLADPILDSLGMMFAGLERPGVRLRRRLEHRSKRPLRRSPRRLTKSVPFLLLFLLSSPQLDRRMLTFHI